MEPTSGLAHVLDRLTGRVREGLVSSVQVRRTPEPVPDVALLMKEPEWASTTGGRDLLEQLSTDCAFASSRQKGQRLTLRFSDAFIGEVGAAQELGASPLGEASRDLLGSRYLVDFCDPNANKAFHVGHLRNVAFGQAIACLLEALGAEVVRQSVVCDFGRNIGETMAGYLQSRFGQSPGDARMKSDSFIGACYSAYVLASADGDETERDPASRELSERGDFADAVLHRLASGDAEMTDLWRRLRAWALDGQQETLDRLGVRFDRILFESASLTAVDKFVRAGMARGVFERGEEGAIVYKTGNEFYGTLVLLRSDGLPTEHLRALVLWSRLQAEDLPAACIHVMGDEWVASTIERQAALARLMPTPLYASYIRFPVGMVTVNGSKLKSAGGPSILADDVLAAVTAACPTPGGEAAARIVVFSYFLLRPPANTLEFHLDRLLDPKLNQGWTLAAAWARARSASGKSGWPAPKDAHYRFAVLQGYHALLMLRASFANLDASLMVRALVHLATWYLGVPDSAAGTHRIVFNLLVHGLRAVGLVTPREAAAVVPR
jgi:arginyl-tRNA synthetase